MVNQEDHSNNSGGFFSGLLFGAVAGALGYFLLGTEEGKSARKRLGEEWEKAKEKLAEEGVISSPDQSLTEVVQESIHHVIEPQKNKKVLTLPPEGKEPKPAPRKKVIKKLK